jgi:hypothetical protein
MFISILRLRISARSASPSIPSNKLKSKSDISFSQEMGSYMHCKKGFSSLVASYTSSMASLKRSHRQLRHAWRVGSELLGEMASVIVDAEAFQSFVAEQGCESSLVKQTLKQLLGIAGL